MNPTQYHELVDAQWMLIEDGIDACGADIDYETTGNVLTLDFADRSQIVINRQEPLYEIWLASKSGGFHFRYQEGLWICSREGGEFMSKVKEECRKHALENVEW